MFKIYPIDVKFPLIQLSMDKKEDFVDFDFAGMLFFARFRLHRQKNLIYKTLPSGHAAHYPISFESTNFNAPSVKSVPNWYNNIVTTVSDPYKALELKIHKETRKIIDKGVIILNCLDSCYGHVVWKLFNAQRHLKNDAHLDLIIIIPSHLKWLVPEGVAELWLVSCQLSQLNFRVKNFDEWIKNELSRFSSVYLSKAYIHLDHQSIDLKAFHKTVPFNLDQYSLNKPTITFVLRENRFWMSGFFFNFLYKLAIKFNRLAWLKPIFIKKQNAMVNHTIQRLYEALPDLICNVIGVGKSGKISRPAIDRRCKIVNESVEKEWCSIAATSHVVIGVHGSHMIIPTSLSGGFVNLVPDFKIDNMIEDVASVAKGREALFLSRFLPVSSTSKYVAKHLISMIKIFPSLKKNLKEGKVDTQEKLVKTDKLK